MKASESESTWRFLRKHADFSKLLTARFISVAGDNIHTVTTMLLVQKITGSALALGTVFIANTIPRIVFSMIGGVTVDRYDRKKILILCDGARTISVFALAILALTGKIQVWHVALVAALNGTASGFYPTAVSAVFPTIIEKERLQKANAVGSINVRLSSILGASIGGFIFALLGGTLGYGFDAFSFLISMLIILSMTIPKLEPIQPAAHAQASQGVWKEFKEGWGFVLKHPDLLSIVALSVAATFVSIPVAQLLPTFSANSLHLSSGFWFGFLWSGMSIGMLLGGFFLNRVKNIPNKILALFLNVVLFGAGAVVLGLSQHYAIAIISMIAMGFGFGSSMLLCDTIFMLIVPKNILGRFYGNIGMFTMGLMPAIMWLAGFTADKFSAATIFTVTGGFLLTFCLAWMVQYKRTSESIREQEGIAV